MFRTNVSFNGNFLPKFDLKNMISTYTKDFSCGKKWPKFCQISIYKIPNCQSPMITSRRNIYRGDSVFFFPSYLHICYVAKFGLIFFLNDHHFGYIIKSLKRNPVQKQPKFVKNKAFYHGTWVDTSSPQVSECRGARGVCVEC